MSEKRLQCEECGLEHAPDVDCDDAHEPPARELLVELDGDEG